MTTLLQLRDQWPFAFDVFKFANGLLLVAILFVHLEKLFALRPQRALRDGFLTDTAYYFLSSLLPNRLLALPVSALAFGLQYAGISRWNPVIAGLPLWLRFALSLLVAEIGFYWGHRWMHENRWLWRFHAIHHSATSMDWLVNTRAHPVDLVFIRLCGYVPLYVLGMAQAAGGRIDWVPLLVALVGSIWGYLIHANLRFRFGWLENVIATPAFHHWHHNNAGPSHRNQNYAPMWPWMDRVFGTFSLDRVNWPGEYGICEQTESGLLGQLLQPFAPALEEGGLGRVGEARAVRQSGKQG